MSLANSSNVTSVPTIPESPWRDLPIKTVQCVFTILLNGFILIVFFKMKKFTFSNLLFISLSLSDIVVGIFIPFAIINHKYVIWPLDSNFCVFFQILAQGQLRVSAMIVNVISLHRFLHIVKPFKAHEKLSIPKWIILVFCWVFPLVYMTVLMLLLVYFKRFNILTCTPQIPGVYIIIHVAVIDMIPTTSAIFLNFYNIYALYKKSKKAALNNKFRKKLKSIAVQSTVEGKKSASMANSYSNTEGISVSAKTGRGRESRAESVVSTSKVKRDLRATVCLVTIIVNVIITEFPYLIAYPWVTYCPTCMNIYLFTWLASMVCFFPMFNPIILIIFNPSFQRESIKILRSMIFLKN